uniref:Uncharacterized protein n=1 Tax=Roseihalotalea indica TaxID=2867963 RepID=A0AA49GKX5_9BACT|nr:hypothetical protein K4G66_18930 [Tunicatimonas sp. TK19036]
MSFFINFKKYILLIIVFSLYISSGFAKPVNISDNVVLISFNAKIKEEKVIITWKFENIAEGAHTYLERAGSDMQFETIGAYSSNIDGQFVNEQPCELLFYYRLVTKYANGNIIYHPIIIAN